MTIQQPLPSSRHPQFYKMVTGRWDLSDNCSVWHSKLFPPNSDFTNSTQTHPLRNGPGAAPRDNQDLVSSVVSSSYWEWGNVVTEDNTHSLPPPPRLPSLSILTLYLVLLPSLSPLSLSVSLIPFLAFLEATLSPERGLLFLFLEPYLNLLT